MKTHETRVSGYAQTVMVWNSPKLDTLVFARTLEDVLDMTGAYCKAVLHPEPDDEPSYIIVSPANRTVRELDASSLSALNDFGAVLLPSEYRGQDLNLN